MPRCDYCDFDGKLCPGISIHCSLGQHCVTTVEVCAMEWRGGENPGGHPRRCEDCGAPLDEEKP